jgi:hypothetical protein
MLIQLIVVAGAVAGILMIGLLAVIPSLLDYASGSPGPALGARFRTGGAAAGGPPRA